MVWFIRKFAALLKRKTFKRSEEPLCRMVEINVTTQEVVFQVRNKSILLRFKFAEAINDRIIIENIAPWEACWLGGHFGRALRATQEGRNSLKKAKKMCFLLTTKGGRYRVVFENRTGEIGYIDTKTGQEFVEHPLTIATNEFVINRFNSGQACYIGILAGIRMEKAVVIDKKTGKKSARKILKAKPKLRVVD